MPRPVARRLTVESLEARLAPANLLLTSIQLVDGNNAQITAPVVGQQVFYRASWSATGFASSSQYVVRYTIDGVSVDSPVQNLGNGTFTWYRGITYASPGPHAVSITVDGGGAVAESNETDNTLTASFTPVLPSDLPQKFTFPVAGVPHRDYSINNYVDVDPRTGSRADFRGGPFQYDGHDAIDVGPATFSDQDRGLPVLAAAAGTVTAVTDGYFDRQPSSNPQPGNFVTIDHGNGWQTVYYHFAANTIVVKVGDVVTQNQLLGLMGSSGNSTASHLHWSVFYRGANVETFYAPTSYWISPPVYQGDAPPTVMRSGISNYDVGPEQGEGASRVTEFPTSQSWNVVYWYHMSNYRPSSQVAITWYRPGGSVYTTFNQTPNFQQPSLWNWSIGTGWKSALGTWNVALSVDGVELDRQAFNVVSDGTEPEASVSQGSTYIVDDRLTPIDLGTVAVGASAPQLTFTITNRGAGTLTTAFVSLPTGFSLVGAFPSSVPANSSDTFVVQLDSTVVGRKLGEIRIATNDSDEPDYTFLVSGQVTGSLPTGTPVLGMPGPAVPYGFGKAPVVIDAGADVNDTDAVSWNGSSLRAAILTNGSAADRLGIRHQGSGTGQVGVTGANITYGGQTIASFSGGSGTTPLLITFTNLATLPAVRAVLRNLTYANVATTPDTRPRFLGFTFTDSTGKIGEQKVKRVTSTPTPLNDAPILTPGLASDLPPTDEDITPTGIAVASLVASSVTDADQMQAVGLAVTGSTGGFGAWQYSITGGSTWVPLGTVSATSARLFPATALLRFLPVQDGFGTATLTYRAWDGTQGAAGTTIDLSAVPGGGQSAFSTASATSNAVIRPINDLPSYTPGGDVLAQENSGDVSLPWASNISAGPANENQTVQFLLTVGNLALFQVDPTLSPQGVLAFRPAPGALGSTSITVQLLDSGGGITPAQTFTLTIAPVNDAPVLVPFARVLTSGAAFSVATLLGDSVSDADADAVEGIAITGFSRTAGDWQYTTNGGGLWRTLSSASPASARLLRATDLLRFQPDFANVGFGDLTFRAWDQTQGTAGGTANLTGSNAVGGFSPYSTAEASASLFLGKGLLGLVEDATPGNGGLVSQVLLRSDVADPDAGASQGVAIIGGTSGSAGQWEYQLAASTTWVPMSSLTRGRLAAPVERPHPLRSRAGLEWHLLAQLPVLGSDLGYRRWSGRSFRAGGHGWGHLLQRRAAHLPRPGRPPARSTHPEPQSGRADFHPRRHRQCAYRTGCLAAGRSGDRCRRRRAGPGRGGRRRTRYLAILHQRRFDLADVRTGVGHCCPAASLLRSVALSARVVLQRRCASHAPLSRLGRQLGQQQRDPRHRLQPGGGDRLRGGQPCAHAQHRAAGHAGPHQPDPGVDVTWQRRHRFRCWRDAGPGRGWRHRSRHLAVLAQWRSDLDAAHSDQRDLRPVAAAARSPPLPATHGSTPGNAAIPRLGSIERRVRPVGKHSGGRSHRLQRGHRNGSGQSRSCPRSGAHCPVPGAHRGRRPRHGRGGVAAAGSRRHRQRRGRSARHGHRGRLGGDRRHLGGVVQWWHQLGGARAGIGQRGALATSNRPHPLRRAGRLRRDGGSLLPRLGPGRRCAGTARQPRPGRRRHALQRSGRHRPAHHPGRGRPTSAGWNSDRSAVHLARAALLGRRRAVSAGRRQRSRSRHAGGPGRDRPDRRRDVAILDDGRHLLEQRRYSHSRAGAAPPLHRFAAPEPHRRIHRSGRAAVPRLGSHRRYPRRPVQLAGQRLQRCQCERPPRRQPGSRARHRSQPDLARPARGSNQPRRYQRGHPAGLPDLGC
ncbi:MAG: peptidoglycan DD-metalloendopeptidase family protein [Gemmataceae bacterium]